MTKLDNINLDGQLAYLKPTSSNWQALTEESYQLFNTQEDKEQLVVELSDDDKKKLSLNKQYCNDILSKSLQLPNLTFFSGSGTSLAEVNGPSMWDLWCKAMWFNPAANEDDADYNKLSKKAESVCNKVKYNEAENKNIEHFLSQCDAFLLFNEDDEVDQFLISVKKIILYECSSFIDNPGSMFWSSPSGHFL